MPSPGPEISIIVPIYNEVDNLAPLTRALAIALEGIRWEVIFVDDGSPDGTAQLARRLGEEDRRIRCIQRTRRSGLSSACIEGMRRMATRLCRWVTEVPLTDPLSGFFMVRRTALDRCLNGISGYGGKILLDLVSSSSIPLRCRELPYRFRNRLAVKSKLDIRAAWGFGRLLLDKLMKRRIRGA